ncbi:Homeodomain-like protein, partial [Geranomyces variabilis]
MQALPAVRKRSRINADQLAILNAVFSHTFFPTTEIRLAIARETGLSARTVQVWFQNRRQQWRARNGSPPAVGG